VLYNIVKKIIHTFYSKQTNKNKTKQKTATNNNTPTVGEKQIK